MTLSDVVTGADCAESGFGVQVEASGFSEKIPDWTAQIPAVSVEPLECLALRKTNPSGNAPAAASRGASVHSAAAIDRSAAIQAASGSAGLASAAENAR